MRAVVLAILAAVAVGGCKKHPKMTVPTYEGGQMMNSGGNIDTPTAITFHSTQRTPDSMAIVRPFYVHELEEVRHWKLGANGMGAAWSDGNMNWKGGGSGSFGLAEPIDPTLPGGFVQIIETDRETFVDIWEYQLKPAK